MSSSKKWSAKELLPQLEDYISRSPTRERKEKREEQPLMPCEWLPKGSTSLTSFAKRKEQNMCMLFPQGF